MITFILVLGDILIFYLSLFLTLILRYKIFVFEKFSGHFLPFTLILILWILVFYIAGIYEKRRLRNSIEFLKTLFIAIILNTFLSIAFFYLVPFSDITPRRNLFIFVIIFSCLEILWRQYFNKLLIYKLPKNRILLLSGNGNSALEIYDFLLSHKQLGYEIVHFWKIENIPEKFNNLNSWKEFIKENNIDLVVIPLSFKKESNFSKIFYELLFSGILVYDLPYFYETIFKKIPLSEIDESWFLEKIIEPEKFYDKLKSALEFVFALFLIFFLLPLEIFIALLIKITSEGPVIYKQVRIGKNNKPFTLYKFRTMHKDAEKDGPKWKIAGDYDPRFTFIGRILAKTHLDELPQLINILKREISFVGPRPERPEFVSILEEKIPYYNIRHLIKPGITGWAQINYKYGASIEDTYEKLQYDIYYLKNRSIILDLAIILKTLKSFFVSNK
jgi:exopolysaccharide biosynthesis polyprenyl glycosylphosphotransferase